MLCRILPCDLILLPVLLLRGQRSADQHTPRRRALDDRFITTAEDTTDTWVPIKFRGNDDPSPPEASLWRSLREHTRRFKSMQNHDRLTGFLGLLFNKSGGVVVGNSKLVDVECRLVGVPGLLLPPRQLQKDALNDPAIFETFVKTGRRELGVIASPAMEDRDRLQVARLRQREVALCCRRLRRLPRGLARRGGLAQLWPRPLQLQRARRFRPRRLPR